MSNWSIAQVDIEQPAGIDLASSRGTSIGRISGANTWTAWVELISTLPYDTGGMLLIAQNGYIAGDTSVTLLQLATGGPGSENVFWTGPLTQHTTYHWETVIYIPISVPTGSRISARHIASAAESNVNYAPQITIIPHARTPRYPTATGTVNVYGVNVVTPAATTIDPGATRNTRGTWTEIASATTTNHHALYICPSHVAGVSATRTGNILYVGIGASGNEKIITAFNWMPETTYALAPGIVGPLYHDIPVGTRISIASQSDTSANPGRLVGAWILAI